MLHEELQKHRGDLKQSHRKLVDAEEGLRQSQESKDEASERASEAVAKLEELHENVQKIVKIWSLGCVSVYNAIFSTN